MAEIHGPKIVRDGLILNLDAADRNSYPGSGTVWNDVSGNGNNGTLINGPSYSDRSIVFDGSNDWCQLSSVSLTTTSYTKIAWFNPDGNTNNIISGGGDGQHAFWMAGTNTTLQAGHNGSWSTVAYNAGVMTGKWWCGAVTFNTTSGWKLYLNGNLVNTSSSTATFTGGTAVRIAAYTDSSNLFDGKISTVQIYNRTLSAQEILQNYNATKTRFGL